MLSCRWFPPLSLTVLPWWQLLPAFNRASRGVSVYAWLEESSSAERSPRLTVTWRWSCCGWQLIYDWLCCLIFFFYWIAPIARIYSKYQATFCLLLFDLQRFFWLQRFLFSCVFKSALRTRWQLNVAALRLVPHPLRPSNIRVCLLWGNGTQSLCHDLNTVSAL